MRKVSKKQNKINSQLSWLFNHVILPLYDGRRTGCGTNKFLTPSHLIRRSKRPDLVLSARNIKPHCMDCHAKWDSGKIEMMKTLRDYEESMGYIKEVDELYFNRLMDNER